MGPHARVPPRLTALIVPHDGDPRITPNDTTPRDAPTTTSSPSPPQLDHDIPERAMEDGISTAADLGFGVRIAGDSRKRLLNRDGTFNVRRQGQGVSNLLAPYHALLALTWPKFLLLLVAFYGVVNLIFALAYVACGAGALSGPTFGGLAPALAIFLRAFFFSVETFGTIGYGHVAPFSVAANIVMTVESLVGLLSAALTAGLVFARFSRPSADILYSRYALIAPYHGVTAFEFRCANERNNQLIETRARVIFSRIVSRGDARVREFTTLQLEFDRIAFLPLSWTVVHPITPSSPLYGLTARDLAENEAEFLVLLSAIDETFSQLVHSRTSYRADEIVWNARFRPMFLESPEDGVAGMDLSLIHDFEPASA